MSESIWVVLGLLLGAGFMENFINGWHTRAVAHCQIVNSFLSGTVYVLVWYIALRVLVENLSTLWVALAYALGSGLGSLCLVLLSRYTHTRRLEKEARPTNETPDSDI